MCAYRMRLASASASDSGSTFRIPDSPWHNFEIMEGGFPRVATEVWNHHTRLSDFFIHFNINMENGSSTCRKWSANFRSYVPLYIIYKNERRRTQTINTSKCWQHWPSMTIATCWGPKGNPINDKINKLMRISNKSPNPNKPKINIQKNIQKPGGQQTECR